MGRDDIGFDSADNEVTLVTRTGERQVPKRSKTAVAGEVLDEVERLLTEKRR